MGKNFYKIFDNQLYINPSNKQYTTTHLECKIMTNKVGKKILVHEKDILRTKSNAKIELYLIIIKELVILFFLKILRILNKVHRL